MKVNTDGVLLGAWLSLPCTQNMTIMDTGFSRDKFRVLDIGTGTGVIALIIAQRLTNENYASNIKSSEGKNASFFIEAIDIDTLSVEEASYNFSQSPWAEHLTALKISLQEFLNIQFVRNGLTTEKNEEKYDLIVSNPPYFIDSLKASFARRSSSRHNHDLPYEVIIEAATKMLKSGGRLSIVLPADEGEKFISLTSKSVDINSAGNSSALHLERRCRVKTLAGKKEKRYLLEFVKSEQQDCSLVLHNNAALPSCSPVEEVLIMQETGGLEYTEQYKTLTKEFYLKF